MIAQISGKVIEKEATRVALAVSGMVFDCQVSLKTSETCPPVGETASLFTNFMLSNPGNMGPIYPILYGFHSKKERAMFDLLLSVSRLGASKVLGALSTMTPGELAGAILTGDIKRLSTVKGIGIKQGERIVLELQEKVQQMEFGQEETIAGSSPSGDLSEAINALEALGFARKVAEKQIKNIMAKNKEPLSVEQLVRLALMEN